MRRVWHALSDSCRRGRSLGCEPPPACGPCPARPCPQGEIRPNEPPCSTRPAPYPDPVVSQCHCEERTSPSDELRSEHRQHPFRARTVVVCSQEDFHQPLRPISCLINSWAPVPEPRSISYLFYLHCLAVHTLLHSFFHFSSCSSSSRAGPRYLPPFRKLQNYDPYLCFRLLATNLIVSYTAVRPSSLRVRLTIRPISDLRNIYHHEVLRPYSIVHCAASAGWDLAGRSIPSRG